MALTGLDIYKLLPKTNCKECGLPTCLAFAMKLAQKQISLEKCPHITEEAKQALLSAGEPPIRTISFQSKTQKIELGGEVVLYRHDKTFYHPCGLGITISTSLTEEEILKRLEAFNKLNFLRAGMEVKVEIIALVDDDGDSEKFLKCFDLIKPRPIMILISKRPENIEMVLRKIDKDEKTTIGYATSENYEKILNLAKNYNQVVLVKGKDIDETISIVQKFITANFKDLILDLSSENQLQTLENLVQARRLALIKNFRPLGFPTLVFTSGEDEYEHLSWATTFISKYASVIITPFVDNWFHLPLVTLRQNIYTDPQKPITVEPKLYQIGGTPTDTSPLLVTGNFSLTYYTVEPEIVNSKIPSWLLVVDSEGLSILTAWAAEKFTPERIFEALKKENASEKVKHRKVIIPGYVAVMSGKLNEISGWEVLVGPREASGIPKYLRTVWK